MQEYEIVAVLHDERRNGERCAKYWSVESEDENYSGYNSGNYIYDHWFCRDLPKRISKVLNTAPDDPEGWSIKRGVFIVTLKDPICFYDHGHVKSFKNVISIRTKDAPTNIKEVA